MKSLVLDANAIISLFDGDRGVAETMSQAERILIPAIHFDNLPMLRICR